MKKKNNSLKKKKNNSLKLFYKITRRAYKVSKKRELDWKWSDAQKWTSANIFQKYKGTKNLSTIKVKELDLEINSIIEGVLPPFGKTAPTPPAPPKQIEICFNPFEIGSFLLDSFEWFEIDDKVSILNQDVKVDLDLEFDGNVFAKTGVIKKSMLPNLIEIRESMRKVTNKSGFYPLIDFYIVLIEGAEDNQEIACNYYILITFEGSFAYNIVNSKGLIRKAFVSKEQMPISEIERVELIEKQREEDRKKLTRDKAKKFKLPSKVEPKIEPLAEPKVEPKAKKMSADELKTIRWQQFNIAKASYRKDYDEGLLDKAEYKAIILKLESKLEKGGKI